ncbi:S-adenosylmethionine uptake transporter [Nymphon striatum]|nr:S-adenosylmethionine uptake transporter [Nymphon striatum]
MEALKSLVMQSIYNEVLNYPDAGVLFKEQLNRKGVQGQTIMNNLNGIMLMIAGMAGFALEDLFVKLLSSTISISQILITLGICSAVVFAFMAHFKGHSIFAGHVWTRASIARMIVEAIAAVAFVKSLSLFLGVSARDLITRRLPENIASTIISFQAFTSVFVAGMVLLLVSSDTLVAISTQEGAYFLGGIIFGVAGYYGIVAAMRKGDAAIVTPFRYTRLLFSIVIGVIVFNERPDALTLLGSAIVIGTGLFTFFRERRLLLT